MSGERRKGKLETRRQKLENGGEERFLPAVEMTGGGEERDAIVRFGRGRYDESKGWR
jgi:hypothetical protein